MTIYFVDSSALVKRYINETGSTWVLSLFDSALNADVLLENIQADALLADKAYDASERVLKRLEAQQCEPIIPPKSNRKEQRSYDQELYKARHLIENFFAKLKQYRAIATRYDKTAQNFLGAIYLAAIVVWLN